jgi:hypothetical protein
VITDIVQILSYRFKELEQEGQAALHGERPPTNQDAGEDTELA